MAPLDFLKGFRDKVSKKVDKKLEDASFRATKWSYENEAKKRGITVSFFDDNSVCARNKRGKEIFAQFPTKLLSLESYDHFIQQMQDKQLPLPHISSVMSPLVHTSSFMGAPDKRKSDPTKERTDMALGVPVGIDGLAAELRVDIDEAKFMLDFAIFKLYKRFKERLRDKKSTS